jgi:hypothetical protein
MQIKIDVSEKVAAQAEANGLSVERFAQQVVEDAAGATPRMEWDSFGPGPYKPQEAVRNIRELSERLTLGDDVTLKELIHEGHKY